MTPSDWWPGPGEKPDGLEWRKNPGGGGRLYWVPSKAARRLEYPEKPIRIFGDTTTEDGRETIKSECDRHQARMLRWLSGKNRVLKTGGFNGTLGSLIDDYLTSKDSPFQAAKWNTRQYYEYRCKKLKEAAGKRSLANLTWPDINALYKAARKPRKPGQGERIRTAHSFMSVLREVIRFGFLMGYRDCARLNEVLTNAKFEASRPRRVRLTYDQAVAIINKAHKCGHPSIALGQALQFEGTLRQEEVTGQWEPLPPGTEAIGGILWHGRRWTNGVTWDQLGADNVLRFISSKGGISVAVDVDAYPLLKTEIERVPLEQRVGPMIKDERTGLPYAPKEYSREWRKIATAAGVPRDVWNRDSRSGGISEGREAGASFEDLAKQAGHSDPTTTARVYDRSDAAASRRNAELRVGKRGGNNTPSNT